MVFDRRFNAASPRYLGSASNAQQQNDGLRPPLQDYCVLLTGSFLMVLGRKLEQNQADRHWFPFSSRASDTRRC